MCGSLQRLPLGALLQAVYTGPHFPNASTDFISEHTVGHCADGCLYELRADPSERRDLATEMPERLEAMRAKLAAYEATAFNPDRGREDPAACACALGAYGGFWGPFRPACADSGARAEVEEDGRR